MADHMDDLEFAPEHDVPIPYRHRISRRWATASRIAGRNIRTFRSRR